MASLEVIRVIECKEPYRPEGKDWTKYEVVVEAVVDGTHRDKAVMKTFKKNICDAIQAGTAWNVKADVYKGRTSYVVESQMAAGAPTSAGAAPAKTSRPSVSPMTVEEYDALFEHAHKLSVSLVGDGDADAVAKLIATWIIGAKDFGFRLSSSGASPSAPIEDCSEALTAVLRITGQEDALTTIPMDELNKLFLECEKKTNRFATAVAKMMIAHETKDEVPF